MRRIKPPKSLFASMSHNYSLRTIIASISIVIVIVTFDSLSPRKAQDQFTDWSSYQYFSVQYTPNTWTNTAGEYKSQLLTDEWNHVEQTKQFIASRLGANKILPSKTEAWSEDVMQNRHRVLIILIWADGEYRTTQYGGRSGTSHTYWRYLDLRDLQRLINDPNYQGQIAIEKYSHDGASLEREHLKIQKQWEERHFNRIRSYESWSEKSMLKELKDLGYTKPGESSIIDFNADEIKAEVDKAPDECIYGIYRIAPGANKQCGKYRFGIINYEGLPTAVINETTETDSGQPWNIGEIKATFTPTADPTFFIADWKMGNRASSEGYATCSGGLLSIDIPEIGGETEVSCKYIKTYPLGRSSSTTSNSSNQNNGNLTLKGNGSAVVIDSQNQYIITNYHVIQSGSTFKVEQGGKLFEAVTLKTDEKNDLALLRIMEEGINLHQLPISIDDQLGDRVYSAGYPKANDMGDEIKITEGVISAMAYLNDPSRYQTSVPITNGNSGGALLDQYGNLAGITQGGWRPDENTENVNAAVKSLYVVSLAQTEATCKPSIAQFTEPINFTTIEESVLPIFIYD